MSRSRFLYSHGQGRGIVAGARALRGSGGLLIGGHVGLAQALPFPGQQFVQTRGGKIGDASEDVGEPGFWVDVVEACGGDEGEHDGGAVGAALGAGEGRTAFPAGRRLASPSLVSNSTWPSSHMARSR